MTEELKRDLMKKFKELNIAEYTTKYGDYYGLMFAGAELATTKLQEEISFLKDNLRVARKDRKLLQLEVGKGLKDFISLIKIFFAQGGFALQGNIFNAEMLKRAQKDPEKYSTLQVRVCGWNEYFVKLTKEMQDKFIKQCEVDSL